MYQEVIHENFQKILIMSEKDVHHTTLESCRRIAEAKWHMPICKGSKGAIGILL